MKEKIIGRMVVIWLITSLVIAGAVGWGNDFSPSEDIANSVMNGIGISFVITIVAGLFMIEKGGE